MQPPSEDLRVTGRQALDAHQALLLHLPEKQVQALSQAVGMGGAPSLCRPGHAHHQHLHRSAEGFNGLSGRVSWCNP